MNNPYTLNLSLENKTANIYTWLRGINSSILLKEKLHNTTTDELIILLSLFCTDGCKRNTINEILNRDLTKVQREKILNYIENRMENEIQSK